MSCFIAPLVQAAATSVCRKSISAHSGSIWARELHILEKMLWGGSLMLVVDHLIHGELFVFNLRELLCVGLPMSAAVTAVWACIVLLRARKTSRA